MEFLSFLLLPSWQTRWENATKHDESKIWSLFEGQSKRKKIYSSINEVMQLFRTKWNLAIEIVFTILFQMNEEIIVTAYTLESCPWLTFHGLCNKPQHRAWDAMLPTWYRLYCAYFCNTCFWSFFLYTDAEKCLQSKYKTHLKFSLNLKLYIKFLFKTSKYL